MGEKRKMMKLLACVALIGLSVAMVPPRGRDDEAMCKHCAEIWGENGGCMDWYHHQDRHDPTKFFDKRCEEWNKNVDDEKSEACGAWATEECRKHFENDGGDGGDGHNMGGEGDMGGRDMGGDDMDGDMGGGDMGDGGDMSGDMGGDGCFDNDELVQSIAQMTCADVAAMGFCDMSQGECTCSCPPPPPQ